MEDPATWGPETKIVQEALDEYYEGRQAGMAGLSLARQITDALRNAEMLGGPDWTGDDITEGAGPDEDCGCGERITWYGGEWMHIYNPALRGTDDHAAEPGQGYYEPEGEDDDE